MQRGNQMFVSAGWCNECVAEDLLFARAHSTGQIFFVCAACATAGAVKDEQHDDLTQIHSTLAPHGWTLTTRNDVENAGLGPNIEGAASLNYASLISLFPGFKLNSEF